MVFKKTDKKHSGRLELLASIYEQIFQNHQFKFICNVVSVTFLNIGYLSELFVCWASRASSKLFAQLLRISVYHSYQLCTCYVFRSNSKGTKADN